MSTPTDESIAEAVNWLRTTAENVESFTLEQAPLYCQELIAFERVSGCVYLAVSLVLFAVTAWGLKKAFFLFERFDYDDELKSFACIFGSILAGVIALVILAETIGSTIKAFTAPRLVIVEHLSGLLN